MNTPSTECFWTRLVFAIGGGILAFYGGRYLAWSLAHDPRFLSGAVYLIPAIGCFGVFKIQNWGRVVCAISAVLFGGMFGFGIFHGFTKSGANSAIVGVALAAIAILVAAALPIFLLYRPAMNQLFKRKTG